MGIGLMMSVASSLQRKQIHHDNYDITCYVSLKEKIPIKNNREYFWYKNGDIHYSYNGIGGPVLHDDYVKYYKSKQLAEKGNFKYGLKHGTWKSWYENGKLKETLTWKNGYKNGLYYEYDEKGGLVWSGSYKSNTKTKVWINHTIKDTTYYLKDTISKTKPQSKVSKFLKNLFKKKVSDSIN